MYNSNKPFISSDSSLPEISVKVILLSIILTLLLAMSNAFLALKVGILASASIPAAIISMGILRFFKNSNVLENNLVQTAASAGEAVAGGIVYTAPALILIHFWHHFDYWENFCIAILGGTLGVLFSIPLRRILVTQKNLPFPEGQAIAQVLMTGTTKNYGLREVVMGGLIGAGIEFLQVGIKTVSNSLQVWFSSGKVIFGFGAGFSPTMIGVGYLVGFNVGFSMLVGAFIGWFLGIPLLSYLEPSLVSGDAVQSATQIWAEKVRYIGIGAMLVAGLWSLFTLVKPFLLSTMDAFNAVKKQPGRILANIPRTERDIPINYVLMGVTIILFIILLFFYFIFPLDLLHLSKPLSASLLLGSVLYVLILGFISCALTGYFSGLVGVTASPGSAIIIAGILIAAVLLSLLVQSQYAINPINNLEAMLETKTAAAAITIILSAMITGAAAIANDNIQDLKVGHILGATPWKQQLMLLLGVLISAAAIPLVMELLFNVYGIGDVLPHPNMDITKALPAPPAAMVAAITKGVFSGELPWLMLAWGGVIIVCSVLVNFFMPYRFKLSILGIAMGIYLPLSTSIPLFMGALLSLMTKNTLKKQVVKGAISEVDFQPKRHKGILIACGLVSGAALMNIVLAIPFVITKDPDVLNIMPARFEWLAQIMALLLTFLLCYWIYQRVCNTRNE